MDRPRIRVRRSPKSVPPESAEDARLEESGEEVSDGFALAFSGGRGIIALNNEALTDAAKVDRLELLISDLAFPFDITGGVRGLRNRRHVLGRLKITVTLDGLGAMVRRRLADSSWCSAPRFSFEKDHISVLIDYGPRGSRVPISYRLVPVIRDDTLELLIDEPRAYGPLPANPLLVAAAITHEMSGMRPHGASVSIPDPVKTSLMSLLPARGWRLPSYRETRLFRLEFLPDRAVLDFRHVDLFEGAITNPFSGDDTGEISRLRKIEEARIVRDGDLLLTDSQVAEARETYSKMLGRDPDNPVIAYRMAMVDVIDADLRDTARSLAAETLVRHPGRCDLTATLTHGAALAGDAADEEEALATLAQSGNSLERLAAGLRRGQLLTATEPGRAVEALQGALAARREDREALAALLKALALNGQKDQVRALIPRWIAVHKRAAERAAAYIEVGELLLYQLSDSVGAAKHFERAALSDPKNLSAAWGLADSLARAGEAQRAISQFERLERLCKEAGDKQGEARALAAIGSIWIDRREPTLAVQRLREALHIAPELTRERILLADALIDLSRSAEAAEELETALKRAGEERGESWWGRAAIALCDLYLGELADPAAAESWARVAMEHAEQEDGARERLLSALERGGKMGALAQELERENKLFPSPETALKLIQARRNQGEIDGALAAVEHAIQHFPEAAVLLDLRVELCREAGENDRLRDALIKRVESVAMAERRAALELEIGLLEIDAFNNPEQAAPWFKRALADAPSSIEAKRGLDATLSSLHEKAERLFDAGDFSPALQLFIEVRENSTGAEVFAAALGEAEAALELGEHQAALQAAMKAGEGPAAYRARAARVAARAFLSLDGPDEAVRHLEQAAENLGPNDAVSLLIFAAEVSGDALGNALGARSIYERILSIDPGQVEADVAFIRLLEESGDRLRLAEHLMAQPERGDRAERSTRAVELFFAEGQPERAAAIMEDLYSMSGSLDDARLFARALKETARVDELISLVREHASGQSDVDDQLLEELEMLADLVESREELEAAARVTEELARYSDPDGVRCARAARLAQQIGDVGRARSLWSDAIEKTPEPSWIARLVKLLDPTEDETTVTQMLERVSGQEEALELSDRLCLLDARVGRDLAVGRDEDAIDRLAEMVALEPADTRIWERMVGVLERRGKWELLAEHMRRRVTLLELPEHMADAYTDLGFLLEEKLGDELGAQTAYDEALRLVPDHQKALAARAALAYQRQKWDRLEQLLERIDPQHAGKDYELWKAAAAEHMGRADEALALYQQLLAADPNNVNATRGLSRLGKDTDLEDKLSNAFEDLRRK